MYRYFIIILLLFSLAFKGSDSFRHSHSIRWISGQVQNIPGFSSGPLHFEGAVYGEEEPHFPVFAMQYPVMQGEDLVFEILNPVYRKCEIDLHPLDIGKLPREIEITSIRKKSGPEEFAELHFVPVVNKDGEVFLLESFELKKTVLRLPQSKAGSFSWKTSSVLQKGKWVKIKTSGRGIYRIPFDKLTSWGFTSPASVNVYGHGGRQLSESLDDNPVDDLLINRTWHGKDGSGKDCLFFYSSGSVTWSLDSAAGTFRHSVNVYSGESYYYLSQEGNSSRSVEKLPEYGGQATHTVTEFNDYLTHEAEQVNLIHSGRQWFGESFIRGTSRSFSLACPNAVQGRNAVITVNAAGRSSDVSYLDVTANGSKLTSLTFNPVNTDDATSLYARELQSSYQVQIQSNRINVDLSYAALNNLSYAWLDYLTVNWRRQLRMEGDELHFRDAENTGGQKVARFQIEGATSAMRVLDITDPTEISEVPALFQNNQLSFVRPASTLREYLLFRPGGNFPEAEFAGEVSNQNLHGMEVPEFLVITHPEFLSHSERIADFHRNYDGMTVEVVPSVQVFNEFGSGSPDATAIRNFIRMLYDRNRKLKYVMLVGDGSYDNRNILGGRKAFLPTYQSVNSLLPTSSFVSDDYFVILDQGEDVYSGLVDLGIGRLPVSTRYEAEVVTDKITTYYSRESLGFWRNVTCFIGDDGDYGLHMNDSERLADQVNADHRGIQTEKIYFDAYPAVMSPGGKRYPGVTEAINRQVKDGVLVLNYVGHANDRFMADERVLDVSIINSWTNKDKLPIFVTATCEFSRYDADDTSAGEYILFNPNGGGIGLFSTTRVVYAISNFYLSQSFYRYIFEKDSQGENLRMGDIIRLAKVNTINTLNNRNFSLLADPALRLSYPRYKVETKTVNSTEVAMFTDTLGALNKVTITGEITDFQGAKLTNFNGTIVPVVYDKVQVLNTLGNAGQEPVSYKSQSNVIYKGYAAVENGSFTFSFVIPKDISYKAGQAKIIYYADNGEVDAGGAFEGLYIGGSGTSPVTDNTGPEINLYMDVLSFRSGDRTSRNPLLIARIYDDNGINTVGSGIGHDITAILNDDYSQVYVLNEYYRSSKDDYREGTIEFPFRNLPLGEHALKVKVWDVANNSTEAEIRFVVTDEFFIDSIFNYPNPVVDHTYFIFSHNQSDAVFQALIEIFDLSGRKIDEIRAAIASSGTTSTPLRWDFAERGIRPRSGLYVYRIIIRSESGQLARRSGKMMIGR